MSIKSLNKKVAVITRAYNRLEYTIQHQKYPPKKNHNWQRSISKSNRILTNFRWFITRLKKGIY